MMRPSPRNASGQIMTRRCPDHNCSGRLQPEKRDGETYWRCDGLTHESDSDPLVACSHEVPPPYIQRIVLPCQHEGRA